MFFFNDTATTEIYTLSLHDALPISIGRRSAPAGAEPRRPVQRNKVISADAAAQIVLDGDTVATGGFVGVGFAEELALALERRFRASAPARGPNPGFVAAPAERRGGGCEARKSKRLN